MSVDRFTSPASIPGRGPAAVRATSPGVGAGIDSLRRARADQQALYRVFRYVLPVASASIALSAAGRLPGSFGVEPTPGLAGRGLAVSIGAIGLVACFPFARHVINRGRACGAVVSVMFLSSVVLTYAQPKGPGAFGVMVAVYLFARLLDGRAAVYVLAAGFAAVEVAEFFDTRNITDAFLLAAVAAMYWITLIVYRLGQAAGQAEELVAELDQRRAAEALAAGLAERQRLAREMHDVLAHSLSGLMIQLEGARMLAAESPGDPRLPAVIDRARHLGRSGLDEARRAIGMLRGDELPGPERLARLAAQFEQDRGVPCRFDVRGEEHELASEARLTLYRVAQEALTNVSKHAQPDRVELRLAYEPGVTRLTVEDFAALSGSGAGSAAIRRDDDGPVEADGECACGYGLTGMRERAELIGGTLVAETTRSGFRVALDVPA